MSDQQQAKKLYLDDGLTMDAIAQKLGVSRRTVERWSANDPEGKWTDLKLAQKVVSFERPVERRDEPAKVRPKRQRGQIDELEIVESAIVNLDLLLGSMCGASGDDRPVDTRGVGTTAGALVKLLEYRRKVQPPSVAELAEQMIALNVPPGEIVAELKRQWRLRA